MNTKRCLYLSFIILTHATVVHGMAGLATRVATTISRSSARNMSSLNNFAQLADSYAPTISATPQKIYPIVRSQSTALIVQKNEARSLIVRPRERLFTLTNIKQELLTLKKRYAQLLEKLVTETIPSFLSAGIVLSGFSIRNTLTSIMNKAEQNGKQFSTLYN